MRIISETLRLRLREIGENDLDFVAELLGDEQVMRYWPTVHTRAQAAEWIGKQQDRYSRHGCGYWLAIEKATDRPVGQAGVLVTAIDGVDRPTLGWIMHRPFWRRGFAFEAANACISYIFNELAQAEALALIRPENLPSIRLAEKLEMRAIGCTMHSGLEHIIFARERA